MNKVKTRENAQIQNPGPAAKKQKTTKCVRFANAPAVRACPMTLHAVLTTRTGRWLQNGKIHVHTLDEDTIKTYQYSVNDDNTITTGDDKAEFEKLLKTEIACIGARTCAKIRQLLNDIKQKTDVLELCMERDESIIYGDIEVTPEEHEKLLKFTKNTAAALENTQNALAIMTDKCACTKIVRITGSGASIVSTHSKKDPSTPNVEKQASMTKQIDKVYCLLDTPLANSGGNGKSFVTYNKRKYTVRFEKKKKYILVQRRKVFLSGIRGKYKQV